MFLLSYKNTIINQSVHVFSLSYFLKEFEEILHKILFSPHGVKVSILFHLRNFLNIKHYSLLFTREDVSVDFLLFSFSAFSCLFKILVSIKRYLLQWFFMTTICFLYGLVGLWRTRQTEDTDSDPESHVKTTLRELIIYLVFITILCICELTNE